MQITWLTAGGITRSGGRFHSDLASQRYRVLAPAELLGQWGHRVSLVPVGCPPDDPIWNTARKADVLVVSKIFASNVLEIVRRARAGGSRIVVDLCDDHFDKPELGEVYTQLCQTADAIAVSTSAMGELIAVRFGRHSIVIDDPYEAPGGEPVFQPEARRLRLVWFGSPVNFDTCLALLPSLATLSRELPLLLHVVTDPVNGVVPAHLDGLTRPHAPGFVATFTPWSPETTWAAIAEADLVVVPSLDDKSKHVKSPNRVVEPLRLGRFVVAYPLPSYVPLGQYIWLGENIAAGIRWAVANPAAVAARLRAGQTYVAARFAPEVIARGWETLLRQTVAAPAAVPAPASKRLAAAVGLTGSMLQRG